ncbi:MAG: EAL domain-containing protein [Gammaproteobacteria bacterium]|nr:MAG: EAL domain-containing protein [Gammaproteobacteria bacterium]
MAEDAVKSSPILLRQPHWWQVLAFLLPVSLVFSFLLDLRVEAEREEFLQTVSQATEVLEQADRNALAMLNALAATQQGMSDFDPSRLAALAASIRQASPETHLIAYASWVPGDRAAQFVGEMEEAGYPTFHIRGNGPHALVDGQQGYLPIRFLEPSDPRILALLGADVMRQGDDLPLLTRLVSAGRPMVLDDWSPGARFAGDIFYGAPTYRGFLVPGSRGQRLRQFDGVFLLGLSSARLMANLQADFPLAHFTVVEGEEAGRTPSSELRWLPGEGYLVELLGGRPVFSGSRTLRVSRSLDASDLLGPWVWLPPLGLGLAMMFLVAALQNRAQARQESLRKGRELEQERRRADGAMRSISDAVIMLDEGYRVRYLNRVAEEMLEGAADELLGKPANRVLELIDAFDDRALPDVHAWLERMCEGDAGPDLLLNNRSRGRIPVSIRVSRLEGHEHGGLVLAIRDTSREHELTSRLAYQASHDHLTGLLNRAAFEQRVRAVLSRQVSDDAVHALVFIDLDRFKLINDTYGHEAGDQLLKMVTEVLENALRDDDCIGRMGGDEFAILMRAPDMTIVGELADRLRKRLESMRFLWSGQVIDVHASLGVVPVDPELGGFEEIMKNADMACHAAKEAGRNTVHVFQPDDRAVGERRRQVQWLPRLQQALENDQFLLYRQAIWPVRKTEGEAPAFYEFLVRLRDADGSDIAPGLFLPAAERFDMMRCIDRRVIALAMEAMGDPECMPPDSRCTINLSGQTLTDEGLVDYIEEEARRCKVPPERVCFEITETAAITNLEVARKLAGRLRAMGYRLMLDDFGAGMSSLGYLHNLQVDYIKIDGQFVRNAVTDPLSAVSVRMICEIAQVLGVETVAEMIEDSATVMSMRKQGVDYLQGYGLSRPEPVPRSHRLRLAYSSQ